MHLPAIRQPTNSRLLAGSAEVLLILIALCRSHSPALADDASALIGRWLVPSREQEKSRMSPQCLNWATTGSLLDLVVHFAFVDFLWRVMTGD
jgi:hypothetical protein